MRQILLGLFLVLSGCMVAGPDPGTVEVTAPAKQYALDQQTVIEVNVANETADTLYYNGCSRAVLQRVAGSQVQDEWRQGECECLCFTGLPPGASVGYTYPLSLHYKFQAEALREGTYRLALPALYDNSRSDPRLRFDGLVSSRFELEMP